MRLEIATDIRSLYNLAQNKHRRGDTYNSGPPAMTGLKDAQGIGSASLSVQESRRLGLLRTPVDRLRQS